MDHDVARRPRGELGPVPVAGELLPLASPPVRRGEAIGQVRSVSGAVGGCPTANRSLGAPVSAVCRSGDSIASTSAKGGVLWMCRPRWSSAGSPSMPLHGKFDEDVEQVGVNDVHSPARPGDKRLGGGEVPLGLFEGAVIGGDAEGVDIAAVVQQPHIAEFHRAGAAVLVPYGEGPAQLCPLSIASANSRMTRSRSCSWSSSRPVCRPRDSSAVYQPAPCGSPDAPGVSTLSLYSRLCSPQGRRRPHTAHCAP